MRLRRAEAGDAAQVAEIWNDMIRNTAATFTTAEKSAEDLRTLFAARGAAFLVAEQDGVILGFATYGAFRNGPGYAHCMEHSVFLAPDAQGQGIGRALMLALLNVARDAGVHVMMAGISGENPGAVAFHTAMGFEERARLPEVGRKFGRWMDLILMQKMV